MLFNSYHFLLFFPLVVLVYYVIPRKMRAMWLLIASYYFYMSWNVKYAILIIICTIVTWISGWLLSCEGKVISGKIARRCILFCCITVTMGILVFFKYFHFLWNNLCHLVRIFGIQTVEVPFSIILPVGISFYTFQALSYTIDVYRNKIPVQKNLLKYALFVSFFPQLVAGPIERSGNLLSQIKTCEKINLNVKQVQNGLIYMLYGLFLKMVLADNLAVYVDKIFERYFFYGSVELFLAAVLFAFQIYCDFSSYSIIAIGAAQVMGFQLMENFHSPYFAASIKDFWRRWHISLSTWFRDYVYIPLGGSHCSKIRHYCNIMITFLISGLWHGASWNFIIWGGIHGICQVAEQIFHPLKIKIYPSLGVNINGICYRIGRIIFTFGITTFAWIFFRADSIGVALSYIYNMLTKWNFWVITDESFKRIRIYSGIEWMVIAVGLAVLLGVDLVLDRTNQRIDEFLDRQGNFYKWLAVMLFIITIVVFGNYGGYEANAFIYFQF